MVIDGVRLYRIKQVIRIIIVLSSRCSAAAAMVLGSSYVCELTVYFLSRRLSFLIEKRLETRAMSSRVHVLSISPKTMAKLILSVNLCVDKTYSFRRLLVNVMGYSWLCLTQSCVASYRESY